MSHRPKPSDRLFTSDAIENVIKSVSSFIVDSELAWMFENCFPNTLDTTVFYSEENGKPDSFIITGDIDALWLRDSAAQIAPYLPFVRDDQKLAKLFRGLIERQKRCIKLDPYANAFYRDAKWGEWQNDITEMLPGVHERKWEIDSLCYFLKLSCAYWKETQDISCFDEEWKNVLRIILNTLDQQKMGENYRFQREAKEGSETLWLSGFGNPSKPCGLIRSAFRPSDDACILPFLVPSNCFLAVVLKDVITVCRNVYKDEFLVSRCQNLKSEIEAGLAHYAVHQHPTYGNVLAYEVDGYGGRIFMDDANIPSLLSLPFIGYCNLDDPLYLNTRRLILGHDNPYYFSGESGEGIGGPHIGLDYIWPMSIIMRALTSSSDVEIMRCLKLLKNTHAGTGFMHESFHKDNPDKFTRKWFGWVNSLFGELILTLYRERQHLIQTEI